MASQLSQRPAYGGGSIVSLPRRGGAIVSESPLVGEDIFLIDELLNFIVTEADEKIIVGETPSGGEFNSSITQLPQQGGTIKQKP
jgi:hypothetical protein